MYTIREIKKNVDDMNIETKLFESDGHTGKPFGVRVRDLDAGENVSNIFCPTLAIAETYYAKAIAN